MVIKNYLNLIVFLSLLFSASCAFSQNALNLEVELNKQMDRDNSELLFKKSRYASSKIYHCGVDFVLGRDWYIVFESPCRVGSSLESICTFTNGSPLNSSYYPDINDRIGGNRVRIQWYSVNFEENKYTWVSPDGLLQLDTIKNVLFLKDNFKISKFNCKKVK